MATTRMDLDLEIKTYDKVNKYQAHDKTGRCKIGLKGSLAKLV